MNKVISQNLWFFIWHFLKSYKAIILVFISITALTGLWSPVNSLLIKYIVDTLDNHGSDNILSLILWPSIFFVLNFELHNLCWRGTSYITCKLQPLIKSHIIRYTLDYVHQHTHQFFQDNMAGQISSQINTLADNIENIIHSISRQLIRGVVLLIISFISMYYVNPKFFYVLLTWFCFFASFSLLMSRRLITLSEHEAKAESVMSGQLVDSITNFSNVRVFAKRDYEINYINKALIKIKDTFQAKTIYSIKLHLAQGFSQTIMLSVMLYLLIDLRSNQLVTIGDFALILGLSVEVGFTVWWSLEQIDELNKAVGKCKQSMFALFVPHNIQDKENASILKLSHGQIVFSNVKFHYKGSVPLFNNMSLKIDGGQKIGLVGYSGSGKTTFVNLILRLYDVSGGNITIDGQDISLCSQSSLHTNIGMIPQDPSLFHRSIMENIRYGRIDASDEEVIEAAKGAYAHDFIIKLPDHYNSEVGERGIKLSGGQRQRIAIARAILKNAPILILDEATSALDSVTENEIKQSLHELMQNKTTLVVAHRLSTLLNMDRILVFKKGAIVEDGTHSELLAKGGMYKTLWDAQVGGFILENQ